MRVDISLIYWVIINASGSVVALKSLNQVSQDNLNFTPLSKLNNNLEPNKVNSTAKLQVTFYPPASLKIKPLSGIPLYLLAISILSIITVTCLIFYPFVIFVLIHKFFNV